MKRHFMAGLGLLLPAVLTIVITIFFVNLLTQPFHGIFLYFLNKYHLGDWASPEIIFFLSKFFVLISLVIVIFLLGLLGSAYFFYYFFKLLNALMGHIPLINRIYKPIQDAISTLFSPGSSSFSKVVLVPYPTKDSWAIGLISQADLNGDAPISVFVPGTPNPMGYMVQYKKEQMIFIDMSVDEAFRFIVSCGVMYTPFMKQETTSNAPSAP
jgi:uncharacterized membrane protein